MAFEIKPFKQLLTMTKQMVEEAMIPLRVRAAKAKADSKIIQLEEAMLGLESEINLLCAEKELDFDKIATKMDAYEMTDRRKSQVQKLIDSLFPKE